MAKQRIILVDDHEVVRLGLKSLLERHPQFDVVGEAGSAREAIEQTALLKPEVVVMDIRLPGESGIEATREITQRFPDVRVVMLTSFADDDLVMRAIMAGAVGYVLKQVGNEELLRAIGAAARGQALIDPTMTARLLSRVRQTERKAEGDAFRDLSDREMDVLAQVSRGKTNAEIGQVLNLSEKTVRNYVSVILEKLNLSNRIELATYAVEHHLTNRMTKE